MAKQQQSGKKWIKNFLLVIPSFLAGMCIGAVLLVVLVLVFPSPKGSNVDPTTTEVVELTDVPTDTLILEPTEAPEVCTRCGRTDTLVPEPTATVEVAATDTPMPEPTTWVGVIDCAECIEGDTFTLWAEVNDIGYNSPKVMYGDICMVLEMGVTEEAPGIDPGIEKYKLDCDGKIGWLRAEGVKPAE